MHAQIIKVLLDCCTQCKSIKPFEQELLEDIRDRGEELSQVPQLWQILGNHNPQQKPQHDTPRQRPLCQFSLPAPTICTIDQSKLHGVILDARPACKEHDAGQAPEVQIFAENFAADKKKKPNRPSPRRIIHVPCCPLYKPMLHAIIIIVRVPWGYREGTARVP